MGGAIQELTESVTRYAPRVNDFLRHLDLLYACRSCPNVVGRPITGGVEDARVMLVGQAPGPHEMESGRPFAYTAGKRLFTWFAQLGVDEATFRARVHIGAVIRCFPGKDPKSNGDRVPDADEIARCGQHLDRELALIHPELIIAVGTLSAMILVGENVLTKVVGRLHRITRVGREFDVVVLPHPSGRSTWLNKPAHAALLDESLRLIAQHAAWKGTFAPQSSGRESASVLPETPRTRSRRNG